MGIGVLLSVLDFAQGKKTIYSIGIAAGVGALHVAARGVAEAIVPGNEGVASAIDQAAAWGYGASGIGAAYGLGFKVIRRARPDAATVLIALIGAGLIGSSIMTIGCATNTETGERLVDRTKCLSACNLAESASPGVCAMAFSDDVDAAQKCIDGVATGAAACRLGCGFADDVPATRS